MGSLLLYSCTFMQALDMIRGKNVLLLMDSHLEGNFSTEEATVLVGLASQCLQYEPRERPNLKNLVATLAPLNTKPEVGKVFGFLIHCHCSLFCMILLIPKHHHHHHQLCVFCFFCIFMHFTVC